MDQQGASARHGVTGEWSRDDLAECLTIAIWAENVNQRCNHFSERRESLTENSWQFHMTLYDLEHYVEVAALNHADVFVGPEFLFAQNLDHRGSPVDVDQDYKYSFGPDEYQELRCQLWSLSSSFPQMLIVAGTILWSDDAMMCHNTCLIARGGTVWAYDKRDIGLEDEVTMMEYPRVNGKNQYQAVYGERSYCHIAPNDDSLDYCIKTCRDASALVDDQAANSAQVLIIPAYALGPFQAPQNKITIICDGAAASYAMDGAPTPLLGSGVSKYRYDDSPESNEPSLGLQRRRFREKTVIPLGAGLKIVSVALPEAVLQRRSEWKLESYRGGGQRTGRGFWEI